MNPNKRALVEEYHRQALHDLKDVPRPVTEPPTISHNELPEAKPEAVLYLEWNTYRREVARLLAEGREGQWVLIKGEEIIGIWPDHDSARAIGLKRFLKQPYLIHQVREREPLVRMSTLVRACLK